MILLATTVLHLQQQRFCSIFKSQKVPFAINIILKGLQQLIYIRLCFGIYLQSATEDDYEDDVEASALDSSYWFPSEPVQIQAGQVFSPFARYREQKQVIVGIIITTYTRLLLLRRTFFIVEVSSMAEEVEIISGRLRRTPREVTSSNLIIIFSEKM